MRHLEQVQLVTELIFNFKVAHFTCVCPKHLVQVVLFWFDLIVLSH